MKRQISTFLYYLANESEEILRSLSSTEVNTYADAVGIFEKFFKVRKNVVFERAHFNQSCQAPGETAEQHILALYQLLEDCNYGVSKTEMIRDRLVVGIQDTDLSQHLQLDAALMIVKAKKTIRQAEAVKELQSKLAGIGDQEMNDTVPHRSHGSKFTRQQKDTLSTKHWNNMYNYQN
jgi:hypothetical protein